MIKGLAGTFTFAAVVSLGLITSAGASAPQKPVAVTSGQHAAVPAKHPEGLATPRPQPTCGPPVNLISKLMPFLHACPQ